MMNKNLLILGAGQYGLIANEIAESMGCFEKIAFLDDSREQAIGKIEDYEKYVIDYSYAFVAIDNAELRLQYIGKLEKACFTIAILVSPKAFVSPSAQLMKGTMIEPMSIISSNSTIAIGCLVCAGAIVNCNSFVGDGCRLDCGSIVGSGVVLTSKTKLTYNEVFDQERAELALRCSLDSNKF